MLHAYSLLPILVPRAHDPSGLWQGSRALAGPNFLSMRRVFVSNSQPIRFARFDNKSVNRGLPVLDQTRALDPSHRPEGSWALGTRMAASRGELSCRTYQSWLTAGHNVKWQMVVRVSVNIWLETTIVYLVNTIHQERLEDLVGTLECLFRPWSHPK